MKKTVIVIFAAVLIACIVYLVPKISKDTFNYTNANEALMAAHLYEASGKRDRAEAAYVKASEVFGGEPLALSGLAKFYLREKEDGKAEYAALLMKERFPERAEPYLILAVLKIRKNRLVEAYGLCKKALELEPGNEKAGALFDGLEKIRKRPAKDAWFYSEEDDARFAGAVSSLMRENVTLNRE